jgi:hypothetical protein
MLLLMRKNKRRLLEFFISYSTNKKIHINQLKNSFFLFMHLNVVFLDVKNFKFQKVLFRQIFSSKVIALYFITMR